MSLYEVKAQTHLPLIPGWLHLFVGPDVTAMREDQTGIFGPSTGRHSAIATYSIFHNEKMGIHRVEYGIFLPSKKLTYGTVAHEVFHITHRAWEHVEHDMRPNTHEPHAYLCEWITTWVYFQLREHKIKIRV